MILGWDALSALSAKIDLASNHISFYDDVRIPLTQKARRRSSAVITKREVIPAGAEKIVQMRLIKMFQKQSNETDSIRYSERRDRTRDQRSKCCG